MKPVTSRESVDAKLVKGPEQAHKHGPGAFWFWHNDKRVGIILPGGEVGCITLGGNGWTWDGNREKPTFNPSILSTIEWGPDREHIELWHGFMRAGRLESC